MKVNFIAKYRQYFAKSDQIWQHVSTTLQFRLLSTVQQLKNLNLKTVSTFIPIEMYFLVVTQK